VVREEGNEVLLAWETCKLGLKMEGLRYLSRGDPVLSEESVADVALAKVGHYFKELGIVEARLGEGSLDEIVAGAEEISINLLPGTH